MSDFPDAMDISFSDDATSMVEASSSIGAPRPGGGLGGRSNRPSVGHTIAQEMADKMREAGAEVALNAMSTRFFANQWAIKFMQHPDVDLDTIQGFGGELLDAFGLNMYAMTQDQFEEAYFAKENDEEFPSSLSVLFNKNAAIDTTGMGVESNFDDGAGLLEQMGRDPYADVPSWKDSLSDPNRPIAIYDENGIPDYPRDADGQPSDQKFVKRKWKDDKGNEYETRGIWRADPGSVSEQRYLSRLQGIKDSRNAPFDPSRVQLPEVDFTVGKGLLPIVASGIKPVDFTRTYSNGTVSRQRRYVGKGGFRNQGEFDSYDPSVEQLAELGQQIKELLLKKYDESAIGQGGGVQTGELRKAVQQAEVTPVLGHNTFSVSVSLADLTRPARPGEHEGVSTLYYGPRVFFGRPAIVHQGNSSIVQDGKIVFSGAPKLRFYIHGLWITSKTVKASRTDLNIFALTDQEKAALFSSLMSMVQGNGKTVAE